MNIIKQQSLLGKPILGICNGAQILVESGLVPGIAGQRVALTDNKRIKNGKVLGTGYYNAWVHLKPSLHAHPNAFTHFLNANTVLNVPVAHAEGRFLIPEPLLSNMQAIGITTFQYCDEHGNVIPEFPVNPNGSVNNIAALCNQAGNVMAMMPHPERTPNGDCLFESMRHYIESGCPLKPMPSTQPTKAEPALLIEPFNKKSNTKELIIELIITDNHALTIERTLKGLGIPVKLTCQIHWQIECDSEETLKKIKDSGVLYNDKKERLVSSTSRPSATSFLVTAKDDLLGVEKMQILTCHCAIDGIRSIKRGVIWHVDAKPDLREDAVKKLLDSSILFNPISHECYHYV